ncbi:IclR family transcriptional regulator [Streptomyces sp. ET3-23]|uniref:IclR family transcriptional regulator n=1 Tax=Streptomyces sp. ET3-23 TaxID=2885643 RepID=UPI001D10528C|nr:IclR family transcriptional regulator [Streptomyces sp. ET3-23]MCC2275875.1 IclR family transcriptional regulator [Streptomyces sp. ET3-23]
MSHTAAAIRLLARNPERGVTEHRLMAYLGLPADSVRALLRDLRSEGLVRDDPDGDACLPAGPLAPAEPAPAPPDCNDLRASAMNWADALAARSGMSVFLAVPHPVGMQIVHHVFRPDNTPQQLLTGSICPATSALARAVAAPYDRRCVFAADTGRSDEASLAIAVPCTAAYTVALGLTGPRRRLDPSCDGSARYEKLLRDTAGAITDALKGRPACGTHAGTPAGSCRPGV